VTLRARGHRCTARRTQPGGRRAAILAWPVDFAASSGHSKLANAGHNTSFSAVPESADRRDCRSRTHRLCAKHLKMKLIDRLSLRQKLFAMFALVLTFATAQSFYGLFELRQLNSKTNELQLKWLPAITYASDMTTHLANFRIAQLERIAAEADEAKQGFDKELAAVLEQFNESSSEFVKNISTEDQKALYASFSELWAQYQALYKKSLALADENKLEEAKALLTTEMQPVFTQASSTLVTLVQINKFGAHQTNEASAALYSKSVKVLVASGAVMMLACSFLAWQFARNLAKRLGGASTALQAMSDGVLDQELQVTGHDEVDELLVSLQRLNGTLRDVVRGVRGNAEDVAAASSRMLADSDDLAQRSNERAEAITETVATMAQLDATVRQNADGAKRANGLALSTSKLAAAGGQVVSEVVTTMKGIDDSSKRIAAIIGVIDSIAFQTNILALNAAVEAARAGEQGRGFAVVASEVRVLAQRTAVAAREIKTLISASVERVGHGTALADRAGVVMTQVVNSISEVAAVLHEATESSTQQIDGVAQVASAVAQMDSATKQDAALVTTNNQAASQLQAQAQVLVNSVALFRLGNELTPASGAEFPPSPQLVA
jgi:methyl-accepting chemotaxis protein